MGKHNGKRYHFLYRTTNLVNNKFYVGVHSTYNLKDGYLGSGKRLKIAIKKYGVENFKCEILEFFESREEVMKREKEIVNEQLINDPLCMNLQYGGGGGFSSEEHRQKFFKNSIVNGSISRQNKMKELLSDPNWKILYGLKISKSLKQSDKYEKFKKLGSVNFLNKKHSEESKNKMRKSKNQGEKNSQYGTCWINNGAIDKKIKKEILNDFEKLGWKKGRINNVFKKYKK